MARIIDNDDGNGNGNGNGNSTGVKVKRFSAGALQAVTTFLLLCAKQAIMVSKKLKSNSKMVSNGGGPKKIITSISNKAIKLRHRKKKKTAGDDDGVWRREILMGDKCQPLDFSGVIYYDKDGNEVSELPMRSPRASPFPANSGWTSPAPVRPDYRRREVD